MDASRSNLPNSTSQPTPVGADGSWSNDSRLSAVPSIVRPDADTAAKVSSPAVAQDVLNRLSILVAKLEVKEIVVPSSVSHLSIQDLVSEWRNGGDVQVGQNSLGEYVVASSAAKAHDMDAHFAILSADKIPLIAGLLTDRNLQEHWPSSWQNYDDVRGKQLLDHCCGGGKKVSLLRQLGVDAHGVDISVFGASPQSGLHYGRAERLPFQDQVFDRVESRMGVLLWGQDNKQMCRETLSEMIRVTRDGGTIRISPVREGLIRELVTERPELTFLESPPGYHGAFELRVKRPN